MDIEQQIANARAEDGIRTVSGAVAAQYPCPRHCTECEGQEHHWMEDCPDVGDPVMACKHCDAWREMTEADLEQ